VRPVKARGRHPDRARQVGMLAGAAADDRPHSEIVVALKGDPNRELLYQFFYKNLQ